MGHKASCQVQSIWSRIHPIRGYSLKGEGIGRILVERLNVMVECSHHQSLYPRVYSFSHRFRFLNLSIAISCSNLEIFRHHPLEILAFSTPEKETQKPKAQIPNANKMLIVWAGACNDKVCLSKYLIWEVRGFRVSRFLPKTRDCCCCLV